MNTKSSPNYRSIKTSAFNDMLEKLPKHIQVEAAKGFVKWKENPQLVGWKKLQGQTNTSDDIYSVAIGLRYRAVAVLSKEYNTAIWIFVGSHEDYNKFIDVRHTRELGMNALKKFRQRKQSQAEQQPKSQNITPSKPKFNIG